MGGTNAHVVLEAAPASPVPAASGSRQKQLVLLSAKSATALERATARLADHLRDHPDLDLPDVAFTLTHGRKAFQHRRALLASDLADAAMALETLDPERLLTTAPEAGDRPIAFLFPGQGAQYLGMGRGLYDSEPSFRADVDLCCRLLEPHLASTCARRCSSLTAGTRTPRPSACRVPSSRRWPSSSSPGRPPGCG